MTPDEPGASGGDLRLLLPVLLNQASNRARRGLRRLRDPRYAAALLAGLAYFAWILFFPGGAWGGSAPEGTSGVLDQVRGLAPLLLAGLVGFWWLREGYRKALAFDPAEVHFLLPAPLSSGALLRYRLLKLQGGVLFSALILSLLPRGSLPWPARIVSWWLLVTTLHLHQVGSALTRSAGARGHRVARWIPFLLLAVVGVGVAATVGAALPELRGAGGPEEALSALSRALDRPVPSALLLPVEAALGPVFAGDAESWLRSLAGSLAILFVHYRWVVGAGDGLEAAVLAGREDPDRGPARRSRRARTPPARPRRSPLPLAADGSPARAVLWKNLTAFLRRVRPRTAGLAGVGTVALAASVAAVAGSWAEGAAWTAGILAASVLGLALLGPLAFRYDLRRDLERIALLRTLPIPGPGLVAAEVTAAALALTAVQAAVLAASGLFLLFVPEPPLPRARLYAWGAAAAVALPALNLVTLSIQNGLALLFPAWVRIGRDRPGGVDHVGRSVLTLTATLLLATAALAPPVAVGTLAAAALEPAVGAWAALAGGAVGLLVLAGELTLGLRWLGRRYDALDPSGDGFL